MDALAKFNAFHISRLSYREIFGVDPTFDQLIELFKRMPAEPTMTILSNIAVSFYNEGPKAVEAYLRKELLGKPLQQDLQMEENKNGSRIGVFTEMTLFLLMDLCRHYSPTDRSTKMNFDELGHHITLGFLLGNFYSNMPEADRPYKTPEDYTRFCIREAIFNEHDQLRYCMGRSKLIYSLLIDQVPNAHKFDVNAFLVQHYGFTLDDFFQGIFLLFSQWGSQRIERWDPSNNFIVTNTFFKNCVNHEKLKVVIEHLTQPWSPSGKDPFTSLEPDSVREYLYSQFHLKSKPLVSIENRIYPMSLRFLTLLCWSGPYYLVVDKLRELKKSPNQFFHFLGQSTELYCRKLLVHAFGKKCRFITAIKTTPMGDCVIQLNPKWHLVFEVKAKRPNLDAIIGNRPLKENSSVDMMFVQSLEQISKRIIEYRAKFKGRISPIVITAGNFFINELSWPAYFKLVNKLPMFADSKVETPIFLDMETFEIMCACVEAGHSISKIIRGKNTRSWRYDDFKNYLYYEYFRLQGNLEPIHKIVSNVSLDIFRKLKIRIFPNDESSEDDGAVEEEWRGVFGISQ